VRRVFLDANVLFSAAYRENAGLLALWRLPETDLLASGYAIEEARRNLDSSEKRARLDGLLAGVQIVVEGAGHHVPHSVRLAEKDRPILAAAIAAGATHLITGDLKDFGPLLGRRVEGVLVQTPADFLGSKARK
jgi:predicted nucleic acid-binding protein